MRRRSFIAAIPAAAAATSMGADVSPAMAQEGAAKPGRPLPPFQPAGADRFIRPDVRAGDRPAGASFASRSAVYGLNGAAATMHPLATQAAIGILKKGGSAVDAAIAANACLGFLEPTSCGIGGDCFAMLWDPKIKEVVGMAASGRSPKALSLETVRARAVDGALPAHGAISVSVPGALDGWWTLHQRYGKLKWAELFEPAIELAESGVGMSQTIAYYIRLAMAQFGRAGSGIEETENARHTWGAGPADGGYFRNPDLARTYRMIAEGGRDAYYEGPIAHTIEAYFKRIGGWMTVDDLKTQHAEWTKPLATDYRGVTVHGLGANTQGLTTLQMLNILEHFDLRGAGFQSPQSLHLQIEAKRLAYEDRARYYADPHFSHVPTDWLNSKAYAAERARLISPGKILTPVYPGQAPSQGDTTYFCVADQDGMMISMIQSNFRGMGSGLVADGLGFMFQDRGQLFSLRDGHPNLYAPGKRPFQTIIPGFATKDGAPWLAFGVMGGDMQPQGQTQIILNRVDYGLDVQAAGCSPRWRHEGSSQSMGEDPPGLGATGLLHLETGVPAATRTALEAMGWVMGPTDGGFGRYNCIEPHTSEGHRIYGAASEMRADGLALAY